jgi:hypothetical protein
MRRNENTGRPPGDKRFVKKLEAMLGRVLLPGRPGWPKKTTKTGKLYGVPRYPDILKEDGVD